MRIVIGRDWPAYCGGNHAKNKIADMLNYPDFLVPGFWDKTTRICAGAMPSPGFSGHYEDLGISSLKRHDSACNLILGVAREGRRQNYNKSCSLAISRIETKRQARIVSA